MVAYSSSEELRQQYDLNSLQKTSRVIKKPPTGTTATGSNTQQPKVYKVKPIHFRELVQKLTGAHQSQVPQQSQFPQQPQAQPRRSSLQSIAPPPLPINPHYLQQQSETQTRAADKTLSCKVEQGLTSASVEQKSLDKREGWEGLTELTLSPNFQAWFNFAMLSPGPAPVSH